MRVYLVAVSFAFIVSFMTPLQGGAKVTLGALANVGH